MLKKRALSMKMELMMPASKGQDIRIDIQVAYEITDANREREFSSLEEIYDSYPKYMLSKGTMFLSGTESVI